MGTLKWAPFCYIRSMSIKNTVLSHLNGTKLATISTSNAKTNQPESALIAFVEDKNLNLYFQTASDTRKFNNLINNPKIALVIGFSEKTIQYEGVATQIVNADHIARVKTMFKTKKSPTTQEFLNRPNVAFFSIKPTWIAYSDYSAKPPKVEELKRL